MEATLEREPEPAAAYVPRALCSGEQLDRQRLLDAPLRSRPRPSILDAPITKLKGAGPKLSAAAAEIGISSLGDLLRHLPHGYRDRADPIGIGELKLGEEATVEVEVTGARLRPTRRRRLTILEAGVVRFHRQRQGRLVQPGLAGRPPGARHPAATPRQAREARLQRLRARVSRQGR